MAKWMMFDCKVLNVVDGDTLDVEFDVGFNIKFKARVRLADINTPEKGQPDYTEAAAFVFDRVTAGMYAYVWKLDKYGRYIVRLFLPDGTSLNQLLIEHGLAKPYKE